MARITAASMKEARKKFEKNAEECGLKENYLFLTTLKRLDVQIKALDELEEAMAENGAMVTKEYVKDRKNIYLNPAIDGYNKTAQQANNTTQTLIKLMKDLGGKADPVDEL